MNGEGRLVRPRLRFERDFTQLPNAWLRDESLSWKARGILAFLMSHSADWSVTIKRLATGAPEGVSAVRTAIVELEEAGYLLREQTRNNQGQLGHVWWRITDPAERVDPNGSPLFDYPSSENRTTGDAFDKPSSENRTTVEEQVKEHLPRSLKSPAIDARASKEDALPGDSFPVAAESPAERYQRLIDEKCSGQKPGRTHHWLPSGYCEHCGVKQPSAVELVGASS